MLLLAYGALNPDLVHLLERLPAAGDDVRSTRWEITWGGKAANAAVALVGWGEQVRLTGLVIGADPLGDALLSALERPGLDLTWLERQPGEATRHCVILRTGDGERTIVCTGYAGARWQRLPAAAWEDVAGVLVDGFGGDQAREVVTEAAGRGIPVVWLDAPAGTAAPADLVVWSRHEHTEAEAAALARHTNVVLTAGADPVVAWWDGEVHRVRPPQVEAVDGTGAGDVFAAACLRGLAAGWPVADLLAFACAAGAAMTGQGRSQGMPSEGQIRHLLA